MYTRLQQGDLGGPGHSTEACTTERFHTVSALIIINDGVCVDKAIVLSWLPMLVVAMAI